MPILDNADVYIPSGTEVRGSSGKLICVVNRDIFLTTMPNPDHFDWVDKRPDHNTPMAYEFVSAIEDARKQYLQGQG